MADIKLFRPSESGVVELPGIGALNGAVDVLLSGAAKIVMGPAVADKA